MAMSTLETGPNLNWTRDNQMYERYRIWKKKVEFIFCSALADSTPKQLVSYLKYWMGDQGIPLIEKWESTGNLDYSNAEETPATDGGRRRILSSGYKVQTYWDLLDEEFKPKGNKLLSIIELWARSKQGDKPCCDMGQNDTIGKIELIPLFVLSSDNTNCKNDIQ